MLALICDIINYLIQSEWCRDSKGEGSFPTRHSYAPTLKLAGTEGKKYANMGETLHENTYRNEVTSATTFTTLEILVEFCCDE